jgi:hypothetical protein
LDVTSHAIIQATIAVAASAVHDRMINLRNPARIEWCHPRLSGQTLVGGESQHDNNHGDPPNEYGTYITKFAQHNQPPSHYILDGLPMKWSGWDE